MCVNKLQTSLLLPTLLALATAAGDVGGVRNQRQQIRVDLYRVPTPRPSSDGSVQLRLVCQASGYQGGLSVRLHCPTATAQLQAGRQLAMPLCFENCARTSACSGDRFCASAACEDDAGGPRAGASLTAAGLRRFGYVFSASGADSQLGNLTFECRYGWQRSSVSVPGVDLVARTSAPPAGVSSSSSSSKFSHPTAREDGTLTSSQEITATAGWIKGAIAAATVATTVASSGRDLNGTGSLRLIDNSTVYIAGFCAVGLASIAVVALVAIYLVVGRKRQHGPCVGNPTTSRDGDEQDKEAGEQSTNLMEIRPPRPDLLPDRDPSLY